MQVHVAKAELVTLPVDAIVNPTNSQGIMVGAIGEAIVRHGGQELQDEARSKAPIAVGAALITAGGALPAKHIIHAPIADEPGGKGGAENIRRAARAALIAASASSYQVIAIPGMGVDLGISREEVARAIVEEIRAHKKDLPETIYLVDPSGAMVEAFEDALRNAQQGL